MIVIRLFALLFSCILPSFLLMTCVDPVIYKIGFVYTQWDLKITITVSILSLISILTLYLTREK